MKSSSVTAFRAKAYRGVRTLVKADGLMVRGAVWLTAIAVAAACADVLPTAPEPIKEIMRRLDTSVGGATVTTDRLDYAPGDTVTITGAGWLPGEVVAFVLNEDPEPTHALYKWTTVASDSGTIFDRSFAPNESHLRVTFRLDATGVTSGRSATRDFTDGNIQTVTASGVTTSLTMTLYTGSTSCTGTIANKYPITEIIDSSTDGGEGKSGVGNNESIKLEAAATASSGAGEFLNWTDVGSTPLVLAPGYSLSDRIICLVGASSGKWDVRANYGPAITPTSLTAGSASGTYGGTTTLSATLTRTSGGAAVAGKTIAFTLNGTLVGGATTNASGVATLNNISLGTTAAGTYPTGVSATFSEDAAGSTPRYGGSSGSNELAVVKAPLTVTAQNTSRVYGEANPTFSAIIAGFVLSQDFSTSGITGLPSLTTTATTASAVASYPITAAVGSLISANYSFTFVDGSLSVTARPITVTADGKSKPYGAADPGLTYQVTSGSLVNGDLLSGALTRAPGEDVGTFAITQGSLAASSNYGVTFVGALLTIDARAITVTADAKSKTYGDADPALTYQVTTGTLASGDAFTGTLTRAAGENAGTYAIQQGTLALGSNYALSFVGANLAIERRALTVVANAASRSYGEPNPSFNGTVTGIQGSDAVQVSYEAGSGGTVTASTAVGTYEIIPVVTATPASLLDNYTVSKTNGVLTITARAVTVTAAAKTREYGDSDPPLTYAVTTGSLYGTDAFTGALTRAPGNNVGTYPITQGDLALSANYALTFVGADLTVTARAITATAESKSKTYGDSDPALTYSVTAGSLVSGDSFTGALARVAGENVGSYAINQGTLAVSANYALTFNASTLTISPKDLAVTATNASKTYGDAVTFAGTEFNTSGLIPGDAVTFVTLSSSGAAAAASHGTYEIVASAATGSGLGNYTITYNVGVLTVNKAALTITAADKSRVYGDANPPLDGAIAGIRNGDGITATYATSAVASSGVGSYPIVPTAVDASPAKLGNYEVTLVNGSLRIDRRLATWTTNANSKTYGDADPSPLTTGSGGNFVAADNVTASYTRAAGETVAGGPYPITATLSASTAGALDNYTITNAGADFTISKRPATWTTNPNSKTYGDADPAGVTTGSGSNFVAGDGVSATYARAAGETVLGGPYAITATLAPAAVLSNYEITNAGASFTITARAATWTTNPNSKTYGDADPAPLTTGSGSNFVAADNVTATYTRAAGETVAGGPYAITAILASTVTNALDNYTVTNTGGSFAINAAPLSITGTDKAKTYGDPNPTLTGNIVGIKFSDAITATYATAADLSSPVGAYPIVPTAVDPDGKLPNYTLTVNNGTLTIGPAPLTIQADDKSRLYGVANPTLTGTITGLRNGDGITATYSTVAVPSTTPLGPYPIVPAPVDATPTARLGNYTVTLINGTLTIGNEAPIIQTLVGPPIPVALGSAVNISGTFSDTGLSGDTYQVKSTWVSANSSDLLKTGVLGSYNGATGAFSFAPTDVQPGVYTVTVEIIDRFGASSNSAVNVASPTVTGYVVVFDPSAGFVTGGGWINSPAGACRTSSCTDATNGRANFGFNAKYERGKTLPSGNTEFQFHAGDLNFKSKSYEWLVLSGTTKAQFKGVGTINGSGSYSFILTGIDGDNFGNKKPDAFRIKIVDPASGETVYDNQIGMLETGDFATILSGGSIVIHNK